MQTSRCFHLARGANVADARQAFDEAVQANQISGTVKVSSIGNGFDGQIIVEVIVTVAAERAIDMLLNLLVDYIRAKKGQDYLRDRDPDGEGKGSRPADNDGSSAS